VAVTLVVAFHCSVDRASGGFIGVDVFFVLSGYLVTGVLLRGVEDHGRVPLRTFYARRMRRLLPAAAVNLVATAVVFAVIAAPAELQSARRAIASAALYVSNWYFIAESADYFGSDVEASPVAHYWSLSVEEQFYLLWPLLLGGVLVLVRRRGASLAAARVVVGVGLAASLVAALVIARSDVSRAYYGTDTRAYQLLAGALIALSPRVWSRLEGSRLATRVLPWVAVAAGAALVVVASDLVDVGPVSRGVFAAAIVVVLLVALEGVETGPVRGALSWAPLAYLGKVSYGTYLWHWIVVLVVVRSYELSGLGTFAVVLPVATGLASLSYQLLEQPVRVAPALDRRRLAVIGTGLVVSVLVGLVIAPRILAEPDQPSVAATIDAEGTPNDVDWQSAFDDRYQDECPEGQAVTCRVVEGGGDEILVVGDSHAKMITPMLEDLAERRGMALSVGFLKYCPWTWGAGYAGTSGTCLEEQSTMFEESIPALDPDIVVLFHRPFDDPVEPFSAKLADGSIVGGEARASALRTSIDRAVGSLRGDGREVVVIEPLPIAAPEANPMTCLSEAAFLEECRFVASPGPLDEEVALREVAAGDEGVHLIDLDATVCPFQPICDPVVNGLVVRWDSNHLTLTYIREVVAEPFEAFLVDGGVLSEGP
jgi:peptidoglycan/LPS O-acetylase OafA/YrhL